MTEDNRAANATAIDGGRAGDADRSDMAGRSHDRKQAADEVPEVSVTLIKARDISHKTEKAIEEDPDQFRMLTSGRPTGHPHVGYYFGSLYSRMRPQNAGVETWLVIADYQMTTDRDDAGSIGGRVRSLIVSYLAAEIDPTRATIPIHLAIPALN